jgi:hypothetical protein
VIHVYARHHVPITWRTRAFAADNEHGKRLLPLGIHSVERFSVNNNAWFLFATSDGLTAQLGAPRSEAYPTEDLQDAPVARVATSSPRTAPLFRRFRTAAV